MTVTKYQKLMEPGWIGSIQTRNRIIKAGSGGGFLAVSDGFERQIDYYEALAKGGAGLLVCGAAIIDFPLGSASNRGFRLDKDEFIPNFRRITKVAHQYNCPIFIQMYHMGPMHQSLLTGLQPIAASALTKEDLPKPQYAIPQAMTLAEIEDVVDKFACGAEREKKAGFDGIELNAATTHLLNSFLSGAWNKRQDVYGGNIENRSRIVVQIIREIKRRLGKDFPIIVLYNSAEFGVKGGITLVESQQFAKIFEKAGADAILVRAEIYRDIEYKDDQNPIWRDDIHLPDIAFIPDAPYHLKGKIDIFHGGKGAFLPIAETIKKLVSIPVIAQGRMGPDNGEEALRLEKIDFIAMNRRLMADHDLPNKLKEGRYEDIRPCIGCSSCFDSIESGNLVKCAVNPDLAHEREYAIVAAKEKRKVMIIGGGPAGMEAAIIAASRGHEVCLYDKESKLGGLIPIAVMVKGNEVEDRMQFIKFLETQLTKLGVRVQLNTEVTPSLVKQITPETLIIAVGGEYDIPEIPGILGKNVLTGSKLNKRIKPLLKYFSPNTLRFLTKIWMPLGKHIVIIGGGIQGCQLAVFLIKRGRKVIIVETEKKLGNGLLNNVNKSAYLHWLADKGAVMMAGVKYKEVTPRGLVVIGEDGTEQLVEADTIVTSLPLQPNLSIINDYTGVAPEIFTIGDCREPDLMIKAVSDGARAGRIV